MNSFLRKSALGALMFFSASLAAQAKDQVECPHVTIERVEAHFWTSNTVPCGSSISMNIGGVRYTSPPGTCTLLVIYVPEHWIPKQSAGSGTSAEVGAFVNERIFRYECRTVYWFLVIPVDGNCTFVSADNGDQIPNYVLTRC